VSVLFFQGEEELYGLVPFLGPLLFSFSFSFLLLFIYLFIYLFIDRLIDLLTYIFFAKLEQGLQNIRIAKQRSKETHKKGWMKGTFFVSKS